MTYITAEANVVQTEVSELHALAAIQTDDAITELSSAQLLMVGGGGTVIMD